MSSAFHCRYFIVVFVFGGCFIVDCRFGEIVGDGEGVGREIGMKNCRWK